MYSWGCCVAAFLIALPETSVADPLRLELSRASSRVICQSCPRYASFDSSQAGI